MDKKGLAKKIVTLRNCAGMSQEALAAKSGVARGALQQIEGGDGNPTLDSLIAICQALSVRIEVLGKAPASYQELAAIIERLEKENQGLKDKNLRLEQDTREAKKLLLAPKIAKAIESHFPREISSKPKVTSKSSRNK